MKVETVNNIRVITPSKDKWLLNTEAQVISDKVYLGINATAAQWVEITTAEKEAFEKEWEEEV